MRWIGASLARGAVVWVDLRGASMEPTLRDGDRLRVVPLGDRAPEAGEIVVYRGGASGSSEDVAGSTCVAHRVVAVAGGRVHTRGDGNGAGDGEVALERLLGRVVEVRRGGRGFAPPRSGPVLRRAVHWVRSRVAGVGAVGLALGLGLVACAGPQGAGSGAASASSPLLSPDGDGEGAARGAACPVCPVLDTRAIAEAQRIDAENVENQQRVVRLEKTVDDLRTALTRADDKTRRAEEASVVAAADAAMDKRAGRKTRKAASVVDDEPDDEDVAEEPVPARSGKKKRRSARRKVAREEVAERPAPAFEASSVASTGRKVRVRLSSELLFPLGSVRVSRAGRRALAEIAQVLKGTSTKRVEVCGHTDTTGISKAWEDNWQLSVGRAHRVVAYLVSRGVEPSRLVAMGFADTDPVASNDTHDGREKNRRVEIFIEPTGAGPAASAE